MTGYLVALVIGLGALAHQATPQVDTRSQTESRMRFEQPLSLRTADAAAQPVKVTLRDWIIRNGQTLSVKTTGMLVIQMRAGDAIGLTVNGQRTTRRDNEYFTVPVGAAVTIETGNDTAVLTVLEVQR
jgi:hypothetical protein